MSTEAGFTTSDLAKLRAELAFAFTLIVLGGGLLYWEYQDMAASKRALAQAEARQATAERKLRQVRDEEQEIKAKSALFRQLEARRIVGPEQRLAWVEAINGVVERRRLFPIDYEITPQKTLGAPAGPYQFGASTMQFRLPLLHENDLTGFINELRQRAPAVVQVEKCRLDRTGSGGDTASAAGLTSECTLRWITLQDIRGGARK
jgi:hypothetical protein